MTGALPLAEGAARKPSGPVAASLGTARIMTADTCNLTGKRLLLMELAKRSKVAKEQQ